MKQLAVRTNEDMWLLYPYVTVCRQSFTQCTGCIRSYCDMRCRWSSFLQSHRVHLSLCLHFNTLSRLASSTPFLSSQSSVCHFVLWHLVSVFITLFPILSLTWTSSLSSLCLQGIFLWMQRLWRCPVLTCFPSNLIQWSQPTNSSWNGLLIHNLEPNLCVYVYVQYIMVGLVEFSKDVTTLLPRVLTYREIWMRKCQSTNK